MSYYNTCCRMKQEDIDELRSHLIAIKVGLEPGPSEMTKEQIKEVIAIALNEPGEITDEA